MRNIIAAFIFLLISIGIANAAQKIPDFVQKSVPEAAPTGTERMTYMLWDLYDATLFVPNGVYQPGQPLALKLEYLRHLHGTKIADKSIEEIRRQGYNDEINLAKWHSQLRDIFPDVDKKSVITGVLDKNQVTTFYLNNNKIGTIADPGFGKRFFDIWLGDNTSAPKIRDQLLKPSKNRE